MKKEIKGLVS